MEAGHPLFQAGALLDRRDYERVLRGEWRDGFELPAREPALCAALSRLAFRMQKRRGAGDESRVRVGWDEALALLGGGGEAERLLKGGEALHVIEEQWDDVLFVHQLFQEYFAARAVAARPEPELARSPWRAAEMAPSLEDTLAALADSDPLPAAPATGWEETFALAAAMTPDPAGFVAALEAPNLPLAGRCAAQADVPIPPAQRQRLQQALMARSRDPETDLRARIAAARALGDLGDPRFERRRGPDGDYLLPPLVPIAGGEYPLGSDEGLYQDEAPAHTVTLAPYAIGRFPVTNAEWQCFLEARGYEDERWWDTEAGRRWRRGEDTAEGPKQQWRDNRRFLQDRPDWIGKALAEARITSKLAEDWESYRTMAEAEFEALLDSWYPPGRQTRPALWDDPAYNNPAQPVVGLTWHEARAYCAWLSAQTVIYGGGQAFRLPTEAEWEAAARGRDGRRYPWGQGFDPARCNTFETHVRTTTPVGVFPDGDSPEGVAELAGNVWEWTGSVYSPYRYRADDGRENPEDAEARRVVRGGSWDDDRGDARSACRDDGSPGYRGYDLSLRLVCVAPIA